MKRLYGFAFIALLSAVLLVEYDLSKRISLRPDQTSVTRNVAASDNSTDAAADEIDDDKTSFFESASLNEAQKLSQQNTDTQAVDQKMNQIAHDLTPLEIRKVAIIARSKQESEVRRSLAIELLSRSKTPDAMQMLKDFIVSRQTNTGSVANNARQFESVLRVQAIEGIAAYPRKEVALSYLDSLNGQVDERFLKDRIARSEQGLRGATQNKQQKSNADESSLRQLVQ